MDSACTIQPHGMADTLWVKFNRPFRFNDETLWGGYSDPDKMLFVFTPTVDYPHEQYQVRAFRNFLSDVRDTPYEKNYVIHIHNDLEAVNVDNVQPEFYMWGVGE